MRIRSALVVFLGVAVSLGHAQQKKRVAVLNFDYATVQSGVAAIFGSNQDIGKGIADLLVDRLVARAMPPLSKTAGARTVPVAELA
jgi:hypothetical protein